MIIPYFRFVILIFVDHVGSVQQMESLKNNLRIMERAVTQNLFQRKQAMYRELPLLIGSNYY